MYRSLWRAVILLSLVPTLLLWPVLHLHPAFEHGDELSGGHTHRAVVHADFFPSSADDHSEHRDDKSSADDTTSRSLTQIHLPARSARGLAVPARAHLLDALAIPVLLTLIVRSSHAWVRARNSFPPTFAFVLLPTSPRAPPFRA
jgi:hypothetical protein